MSKKVVNIVKKNKKEKNEKKPDEIFNLNEEIIIGINSKKNNEKAEKSKNKKKTQNSKKSKSAKKVKNKVVKKEVIKKHAKQEEVKKKSHKFIIVLLFLTIVIVTGALVLMSPIFGVKKITVKNNSNVTTEEVINLSGIKIGENMFKYININIMNKISENSYIEDVKISRIYPSEIVLDVIEREIVFCIRFASVYAYIDNQGYIVDVKSDDLSVPELIGCKTSEANLIKGNRLIEEDLMQLQKIITIYNYAKTNEIGDKIKSFSIDQEKIKIGLQDDKIAYIENCNNLNIKIISLKVIMERTAGVAGEIFLDGQGQSKSIVFKESI